MNCALTRFMLVKWPRPQRSDKPRWRFTRPGHLFLRSSRTRCVVWSAMPVQLEGHEDTVGTCYVAGEGLAGLEAG